MKTISVGWGLGGVIVFLLLMPWQEQGKVYAAGSTSFEVGAPCSGAKGANTCTDSFRSCDTVVSWISTEVRKTVNKMVDKRYDGVLVNVIKSGSTGLAGSRVQTPICNLAIGEVTTSNGSHGSKSCGEYIEFGASCSAFGPCDIQVHNSAPKGQRETSYVQGTWGQSMLCHMEQVLAEVKKGGALFVTRSACAELGKAVQAQSKKVGAVQSDLVKEMGEKGFCELRSETVNGNNQDINQCPKEPEDANEETLKHYQAACKLQNARANIEGAFAEVVLCEIYERGRIAHQTYFSAKQSNGLTKFEKTYQDLLDHCSDEAESYAKSSVKCWKSGSCIEGRVKKKLNSCYLSHVQDLYESTVKTLFPTSGSCTATGPTFRY